MVALSTFPFLKERFQSGYPYSSDNNELYIFDDSVSQNAIGKEDVPVEVAIIRAIALALYLSNTGFVAESRKATQSLIALATAEGYDVTKTLYWDSIKQFIEEAGEDSVMEDATRSAKRDQTKDLKRWSDELFRGRSRINRTTWRTRLDPLDTLRCATLYLVPAFGNAAPTARDELEGLDALKHFVQISTGKVALAFRRSQAIAYAIDIAAKHGKLDEAFDLAVLSVEGPNYLFPGSDSAFVLYPHFGPIFLQHASPTDGPYASKVARIDELLHITAASAKTVPEILAKHLEARLAKARTAPLPKMPPYAHLRELERVSRRNGKYVVKLRDGADAASILEAEKRVGYTLPDEYKRIVQISNGWEGNTPILPALARVEDIGIVQLPTPVPITNHAKSRNPYNRDATISNCLRIDDRSSPSQLLLVRDVDLKLQRGKKRVRGNDGATIEHAKGDYRVILVTPGEPTAYYPMIRGAVEAAIKAFDKEAGVKSRESSESKIYRRRVPGQGSDDEGDEDEDGEEDEGDDGDDDDNDDEGNEGGGAPKPACWYGRECRTKNHNADHAARYDHTGPNLRT